jgi:serine/threonine protein kinase
MNLRTQWFAYFTQQLGYVAASVLRQLDMSDMSAEEYVKRLDITPAQLHHLRFLFATCCFIESARQAGYLSKEQSENLLQAHIVSLIHQPEKIWLLALVKGFISEKFAEQTAGRLYREGRLDVAEYEILRAAIQASISLPATLGRGQPNAGGSDANSHPPSPDETAIDAQLPDVTQVLPAPTVDQETLSSGREMRGISQEMRDSGQETIQLSESANQTVAVPSTKSSAGADTPLQLGHYQLLTEVGCGGMGKVYKAYHRQLDRVVAIKVMLRNKNFGDKERQRFIAEAKLTARLSHPNIIAVHDVAIEGDSDYIVMDFIEGESLASSIKKGRPSNRKALEIIRKVALAIDYAHENSIVHRDLKPGNIMIEKGTERPVVMDFGLAKNIKLGKELTASGELLGTPRYMSPEQAEGNHRLISPATDVYALGAILYEMIAGCPVVDGASPVHVIYNIMHKEVVPPRQRNKKISAELETICMKALEKEPARRYTTARAMAEDIERFFNGEVLSAHPSGTFYRQWKKVRSHKAAIAMFFLMCLVAASGVVWNKQSGERKLQELRLNERKETARQEWEKWWQNFAVAVQTHSELLRSTQDLLAARRRSCAEGKRLRADWPQPTRLNHDNQVFKSWLLYDDMLFHKWQEYRRLLDSYPNMFAVYGELANDYQRFLSPQWPPSPTFFQEILLPNAQRHLAGIKHVYLLQTPGEQLGYRSLAQNPAIYVQQYLQNKISDALQVIPAEDLTDADRHDWRRWQLHFALTLEKGKAASQDSSSEKMQEELKKLQNAVELEYNLALVEYNQALALLNNLESSEAILAQCLRRLHAICLEDYTFAPAYFLLARIYHLLSGTTIASEQRQLAKIYYEKNRNKAKETNFLASYYLAELCFALWQAGDEKDADKLQKLLQELAVSFPAESNKEALCCRQMCVLFETVIAQEKTQIAQHRHSFLNFALTPSLATRSRPQDASKYRQGVEMYQRSLQMLATIHSSLLRSQVPFWQGKIYMDLGLLEEIPESGPAYLEKAIQSFTEAARWEPWQSEIWWALGQIYALLGDFAASEHAYHRAFASVADASASWSHEAHWHYTLCLLAQSDASKRSAAKQELEKYLAWPAQDQPKRKNAIVQAQLSVLGLLYLQDGEAKKAGEKILPLLELYGSSAQIMGLVELTHVLILVKTGQLEEAQSALQKLWDYLMNNMGMERNSPELRVLYLLNNLVPALSHYDDLFTAPAAARKMPKMVIETIENLINQYSGRRQQMFSHSIVSYYSASSKNLLSCLETDAELKQKLPQLTRQVIGNPLSLQLLFLISAKVGVDTMEQHLLRMDKLPSAELYYRRAVAYYRKTLYDNDNFFAWCEKSFADMESALGLSPGNMQYHYAAAMLAAQLVKKEARWRDKVYAHLCRALELGWHLPEQTRQDPAFQTVSGEVKFRKLLQEPPKLLRDYTLHEIADILQDGKQKNSQAVIFGQVVSDMVKDLQKKK